LTLASLYWSFLFFERTVIPAYRSWAIGENVTLGSCKCKKCPTYHTTSISTWLYRHYETCLWSQLLFAFSLSLAGVVRHANQGVLLGVFESAAIMESIVINICSLILTAVCAYQKIDRPIIFGLGLCLTLICAVAVELFPIMLASPRWKTTILQSCIDYAVRNELAWNMGAVRPFDTSGIIEHVTGVGLVIFLHIVWLLLRSQERRAMIPNCSVSIFKSIFQATWYFDPESEYY
jgi:hypothetical protein